MSSLSHFPTKKAKTFYVFYEKLMAYSRKLLTKLSSSSLFWYEFYLLSIRMKFCSKKCTSFLNNFHWTLIHSWLSMGTTHNWRFQCPNLPGFLAKAWWKEHLPGVMVYIDNQIPCYFKHKRCNAIFLIL